SIQISFVSKLISTVNPQFPVYDAQVARMYAFKEPNRSLPVKDRIAAFCEFYRFVQNDYQRILQEHRLDQALDLLKTRYREALDNICPIKQVDFLVWAA